MQGCDESVQAAGGGVRRAHLRRFADAGATQLQLSPVGPPAERQRTIEFFGGLTRSLA
jgi:hypothetical protein